MKLPNITLERCEEMPRSCLDPRCSDPAFAAANPDICSGAGTLAIKPESVLACAPEEVQFTATLRTAAGEVDVDGATWSSSDPSVLSIGAMSGNGTALAAGVVTVSATWQGYSAFAQVNVLGTDGNCCDNVQVLFAVALDNSLSMGQPFDGGYPTKLDAAKAILVGVLDEMNEKDRAAVESFNEGVNLVQAFTNSPTLLETAVQSVPQTQKLTDIPLAFDSLLALLNAFDGSGDDAGSGGTGGNSGGSGSLHGSGPPSPSLGNPGDTYVDDDTGAFYWKAVDGWHP